MHIDIHMQQAQTSQARDSAEQFPRPAEAVMLLLCASFM
jgi:hypothetical protein